MLSKEYKSAILISVVLHIVLFALLLGGSLSSSENKKPKHQMVEAVVIDPKAIERQAQSIREQREAVKKAEQQRIEKLRQQAAQLEKERKQEEDRLRQLQEQKLQQEKQAREAEKQRQLAEKQRQEEERARIEKERAAKAEAERKAKEAAIAKAAAEKKAAEQAKALAEAKAKAAAEAKAKAEAQAKAEAEKRAKEKAQKEAAEKARLAREKAAQEEALRDIFSGLEAETQQISSARQKYVASELDRYGAIYKQMIQDRLRTDDSFAGKSCKINIRLVQAGSDAIVSKVTSVDGEAAVCSAAKRAVAQVASFPIPKEQDIADQLKNINLTVDL